VSHPTPPDARQHELKLVEQPQLVAQSVVAFGEIGLTGELRPVAYGEERLREAAKQGFTTALVPKENAPRAPIEGLRVRELARLDEALALLGRMVLGVLAQVAVLPRPLDLFRQILRQLAVERGDFRLESLDQRRFHRQSVRLT